MNGLPENQMSEDAQNADQSIGIDRQKNKIPYGYCHCGCGQKTNISKINCRTQRWIKGEPKKFISHHHQKEQPTMEKAYRWNGGRRKDSYGYWMIYNPDHPRAHSNGYAREHIVLAEKLLGKALPNRVQIHHFGEIHDNTKIVICDNKKYHFFLHVRKRAYDACGNPNWRKCYICKQHDNPEKLFTAPVGSPSCHIKCRRERDKELYRKKVRRLK